MQPFFIPFNNKMYASPAHIQRPTKTPTLLCAAVPGTKLQIRQGVTSEDYLLDTVTVGSIGEGTRGQEHVAAIDTGFYVRLRGAFTRESKLAIAYTSFSYLGSEYGTECVMFIK